MSNGEDRRFIIDLVRKIIDRHKTYIYDDSQVGKEYAGDRQNVDSSRVTTSLKCKGESGPSHTTSHERFEEMYWVASWLIAAITGAAAIGAAVFAFWAYQASLGQLDQATIQAQQARRQADAAETQLPRSWLYINLRNRAFVYTFKDLGADHSSNIFRMRNRISIVNYGSTPARNIRVSISLTVCPTSWDTMRNFSKYESFESENCIAADDVFSTEPGLKGVVVRPNGDGVPNDKIAFDDPWNIGFDFFPPKGIVVGGAVPQRLIVDVAYSDPYGTNRETRFVAISNLGGLSEVNDARYDFQH